MPTVYYFYFSFLVFPVSYVLLNENVDIKFSANDAFLDFNAKSFISLDYDLKAYEKKVETVYILDVAFVCNVA